MLDKDGNYIITVSDIRTNKPIDPSTAGITQLIFEAFLKNSFWIQDENRLASTGEKFLLLLSKGENIFTPETLELLRSYAPIFWK